MYSRVTPFEKSDKIVGTHQKIDRASRLLFKELKKHYLPERKDHFPSIDEILKFEGMAGPDGVKQKSPGKDEPWHFVDPEGDNSKMFTYIDNHIYNLAKAIKEENHVRASFEAAWMAHAITDALTPAHQYPMEDHIISITGKLPEARDTRLKKMFLPGDTWREKFERNWRYIGPKGAMSSHMLYEMGVAMLVSSMAAKKICSMPTKDDAEKVLTGDFNELLGEKIKQVHSMQHYKRYLKNGWTSKLASETKKQLLPVIVQTVALGWLKAYDLVQKGSL